MTLNDHKKYKVVFVGDSDVGKTSILRKFRDPNCDILQNTSSTLGASTFFTTLNVEGESVSLDIWDTAGQEIYQALAPQYCRNAISCFVVYSINNKESFLNVPQWIETLNQVETIKFIYVVGNKLDLERKVTYDEAVSYANDNGYSMTEVSALTGNGINDLIQNCACDIVNKYKSAAVENNNFIDVNKSTSPCSKKGCCD